MGILARLGFRVPEQAAAPASPAVGQRALYPKSDGWYDKTSGGVESRLMPTKNGAQVDLVSMVNDYYAKVVINGEDPAVVPTASWRNRFEMLYKPFGAATPKLVVFLNEYGELRVFPANTNTVAVRIYMKDLTADPNHTGNILEICDSREARNVLVSVDSSGNLTAPNLGPQNQVSTTAPTDHSRVWINIS